jgi:hypothetical protein
MFFFPASPQKFFFEEKPVGKKTDEKPAPPLSDRMIFSYFFLRECDSRARTFTKSSEKKTPKRRNQEKKRKKKKRKEKNQRCPPKYNPRENTAR